ncbi:hypothetical protein EDD21DRAFT_410757 [Dissophora ornata]|nr:hypothetical protein BGZ58_009960 [Dissophora ornata]KAI8605813.1 hypothetical protein EDD21DRAFT_410757 [Dissophora ornata]
MAPKQKATDAGPSSSSGGKPSTSGGNSHSNDRQGNSERGHGHTNGGSASERGGGPGTNDRSSSGAGHGVDKTLGSSTGGAGTKRKAEMPVITLEFTDMDVAALRRYCRLNKLKPKSKSRDDLVAAASKHWSTVNAKEVDSVAYFLFAVKHRHNVLKLTMPLP